MPRSLRWSLFFVMFGVLLLALNYGAFSFWVWRRDWPFLLAGLGVWRLARDFVLWMRGGDAVRTGRALSHILLIALGGLFLAANFDYLPGWRWGRDWPFLLVGIGAFGLLGLAVRAAGQARRRAAGPRPVSDILRDLENGKISSDKAFQDIRERMK
ncbi:MAG: DUF5668 domain-containing protein [Planctomycetota bacterium]